MGMGEGRGGNGQRERVRHRREGTDTEEDKERGGVDGGNSMNVFVCRRIHANSWNMPAP